MSEDGRKPFRRKLRVIRAFVVNKSGLATVWPRRTFWNTPDFRCVIFTRLP